MGIGTGVIIMINNDSDDDYYDDESKRRANDDGTIFQGFEKPPSLQTPSG